MEIEGGHATQWMQFNKSSFRGKRFRNACDDAFRGCLHLVTRVDSDVRFRGRPIFWTLFRPAWLVGSFPPKSLETEFNSDVENQINYLDSKLPGSHSHRFLSRMARTGAILFCLWPFCKPFRWIHGLVWLSRKFSRSPSSKQLTAGIYILNSIDGQTAKFGESLRASRYSVVRDRLILPCSWCCITRCRIWLSDQTSFKTWYFLSWWGIPL